MRFRELFEDYKTAARAFVNQGTQPDEVTKAIMSFKELNTKNQFTGDDKNIDKWVKKGWFPFIKAIAAKSVTHTKTQFKRAKIAGGSIDIVNNEEWTISVPLTKAASCRIGKNTRWCTSKPNNPSYEEHTSRGEIFVYFVNKVTKQKWAISYENSKLDNYDFFDQQDETISQDEFEMETGFWVDDITSAVKPHINLIIKSRRDEILSRQTAVINSSMNSPSDAYIYAETVIRGRWPPGEALIATDGASAVKYAKLIKDRFPPGESTIASDAGLAARYAVDVIRGRWPPGEKAIATTAEASYQYAGFALEERWPPGEKAIAKDSDYACWYALRLVKDRWPPGEKAIAKDSRRLADYNQFLSSLE